jgi:hypothetical protein
MQPCGIDRVLLCSESLCQASSKFFQSPILHGVFGCASILRMTLRGRRSFSAGEFECAGLAQDVTDKIIKLAAAEALPVVDRHGISGFPLDRNQAGFHEQIKPAISILQLQRALSSLRIVPENLRPSRATAVTAVFGRASVGLENRIANLAHPDDRVQTLRGLQR